MKIRRGRKGFTLVEIMVVLLIIGVLVSLTVPNFMRARASSRRSICINNLRIIQAAKDRYATEYGQEQTATPTPADLSAYFKAQKLKDGLPEEPTGNAYSINAVSVSPTCGVDVSLSHSV